MKKIYKILIFLVFAIVTLIAAVLSVKIFMPDLFETVKYGVEKLDIKYENANNPKPSNSESENTGGLQLLPEQEIKYGVGPVR